MNILPRDVIVEANVIIADRSISPSNKIVQLLEAEPPGEQPYKNNAKASNGSKWRNWVNEKVIFLIKKHDKFSYKKKFKKKI